MVAGMPIRSTVVFALAIVGAGLAACGGKQRDFSGSETTSDESDPSTEPGDDNGASATSEATPSSVTSGVASAPVGETSESVTHPEDTSWVAPSTGASSAETSASNVEISSSVPPNDSSEGVPPDATVRGRVIDFWGNPVPNLYIDIEGDHATTDRDGAFEIADVEDTYDVSFVVEQSNPATFYGWRFERLTRRDPTLQIYVGLPSREATVVASPSAMLQDNDTIGVTFATDFGVSSTSIDGATELTPDWRGATETLASLHALLWTYDVGTELPTNYGAYFNQTIALSDGARSEIEIDLGASERLEVSNVGGTVTAGSEDDRTNALFVQFQDGGSMQLLSDAYPSPTDFLYLAPSLPNASLIVAASQGLGYGSSYSMVHQRGVAPGTLDVHLDVPAAPRQNRPLSGDEATAETDFTWTLSGNNKVVVVHVEDQLYRQGLYVVTAEASIRLPTFESFGLRRGGEHLWEVETHMMCATLDDCAGGEGFMDPLINAESGIAKWQRDGSYTTSGTRAFVVAP